MTFRTRFAPSPTGPLHLGHAFSALTAHDLARRHDGDFLLRIDDIDQSRARAEYEALIYEDLHWLGLTWEEPVLRQSERSERYHAAITELWSRGLLYPCTCSRRDIQDAASAPQEGSPKIGPDGIVYPGTCRPANGNLRSSAPPRDCALRLNMRVALDHIGARLLSFDERDTGPRGESGVIPISKNEVISQIGDFVVSRRGMGASYHLSVVLDDADSGISDVVRGQDLFEATKIHVILQALLKLPTPIYRHHRLIRDEAGKRLAKRDDARAISTYRAEGMSPDDVRRMVGL